MKPFLSVIIPTKDEAKRLPLTLIDADRHLKRAEYSSEVIVVSDGSTDRTVEIVTRMSGLIQNLKLIANEANRGKGFVVRQAMLEAKGNYRLFMDADNSTSVDQFEKMLPYFKEGYDVVIGSRAVKGAKLDPPQPWYRQILGKASNLLIQLLVAPGIHDTQCGFKCFSEEAAERIFLHMTIDRWGFDIEAIALAKLYGYKIKEMPVRWVNDTRSTLGANAYLLTLRDLVNIKWNLMRNVYDQ